MVTTESIPLSKDHAAHLRAERHRYFEELAEDQPVDAWPPPDVVRRARPRLPSCPQCHTTPTVITTCSEYNDNALLIDVLVEFDSCGHRFTATADQICEHPTPVDITSVSDTRPIAYCNACCTSLVRDDDGAWTPQTDHAAR